MSLNKSLNFLLQEYPKAMKQPFKGNKIAEYIRNEIPNHVAIITENNDRFLIEGSPGKGNWANVPWVAILDRFITTTVQDGYYIVYLVKEDFSGIYLTLNQGVTTVKNQYGSGATEALIVRGKDYLSRLGEIDKKYISGPIDLAVTSSSKLGLLYEVGTICSLYYDADAIPENNILEKDLKEMLDLYFLLTQKENQLFNSNEVEEDEINLEYENLKKLRTHKRIERNNKLSKKVKKLKGYKCEVCNFNFQEIYGDIGKEFIEAHHLIPLSKLQGEKVALDPIKDFAVLCSNCHRMIHKSEFVSDPTNFKIKYFND